MEIENFSFENKLELRYGENPHQNATFVVDKNEKSDLFNFYIEGKLHGKELSYNNIMDISAAINILSDLEENSCVVIKHTNPCGAASKNSVYESFKASYEADPVSIFGGIVGIKGTIDIDTAELLNKIFLEIVVAYDYTDSALELLKSKKNIRLMVYKKWVNEIFQKDRIQIKKVVGGYLIQETDKINPVNEELKCVTEIQATEKELEDLKFAQTLVKYVKSNAITVVKDKVLIGVGAGQMNRVLSAKIALEWAGEKANGAVLGSDAFFPMDDTVKLASKYGIKAIIQPGGSIKDNDSIVACNENKIAMYFTGIRHFMH